MNEAILWIGFNVFVLIMLALDLVHFRGLPGYHGHPYFDAGRYET